MRIEVTQGDIDGGERWNPARCPLATAIGRALRRKVRVTCGSVWPLPASPGRIAALPRKAANFINAFDQGRAVAPMAFDLNIPEPTP
jgi:hypothetical protein